jgi:hypothetical protein
LSHAGHRTAPKFISHYEYKPDALPIRIETADVVHFRWGLDPQNPRKGCSPLKTLLREIFTDDEASNYTAAMLRNVGVPPVVISPGKDAKPTQEELDEVKSTYIAKTTGDRRGEPIVMRGETSVQVLGFNPQQMDMRMARRVPEERVSAVLGIPAAVVGLGYRSGKHQGRRHDGRDARASVRVEHHPDAATHGRRVAYPARAGLRRRTPAAARL